MSESVLVIFDQNQTMCNIQMLVETMLLVYSGKSQTKAKNLSTIIVGKLRKMRKGSFELELRVLAIVSSLQRFQLY